MMKKQSRRKFIQNSLLMGCSMAASPLITPVTLASAPTDNRLVVIILRGAMDGLDVVRPVGDKDYLSHRSPLIDVDQIDLNGMFAMHGGLSSLSPLWEKGEMAFSHAVSTPYRDKRSHFDGQDLLEAGYASVDESKEQQVQSGWLNRLLSLLPNVHSETAFAVGQEDLLLLRGDETVASWVPGQKLSMSESGLSLLSRVYENDPLFHASAEMAMEFGASGSAKMILSSENDMDSEMMAQQSAKAARKSSRASALARFAAQQLKEQTRIAAFSISGWDTHRSQKNIIQRPLRELSEAILMLKSELGPTWNKTAVLCMTEFGRTVRLNGSNGTDHGTGGAMLMAGGAIRGREVYGKWPGLRSRDLYGDRDLMPTADIRGYAAHSMRALFGVSSSELENVVFPGLDLMRDPKFLL